MPRSLQQHLDHERGHDLLPSLPDQRDGAVEIEQGIAQDGGLQLWPHDLDGGAG